MISGWSLAGLVALVALVARDLIALRRHRIRHASIGRLFSSASPGTLIIDREPDGAVVEISIGHCPHEPAWATSGSTNRQAS
jgi:hypothetical protein